MRKVLILLLVALMLIPTLASCTAAEKFELALITDVGTIDDKSFNQGAWEGLVKYATEKNIKHKYYKPTEKSDEAYVAAIDLAVAGGAKLVVTPGYLFEPAIYIAQDKYPNVKFVLLDGTPHTADYKTYRIESNVYSIFYAEEQSGFLAGYAAVKDGYRKLGFMGGMAVPAVIRFGYGFVQGCEYAAAELGLKKNDIEIQYTYLGTFLAEPTYVTMAAAWYNGGTELIFAAAGQAGNSVMSAAEAAGKKVIGVDVDQSSESETVITSAKKGLGVSVYMALEDYYGGAFKGGQSVTLDVTVDGVGLPEDFSRFTKFAKADYDAIFAKLVANTDGIVDGIKKDTAGDTKLALTDLDLEIVKVTEVK
ncbi:MAG: BMP family ABC transporter substrate-binding protein [Clostridia bacterium]|nr:BMP family ABC transporter substrate-binding protein [Clostridia bacterium]